MKEMNKLLIDYKKF